MPVAKKKKFKSGKIKRHKFKKKLGISPGFGKPWSAPSVPFRVEFSWENADGSEENEQVHWIECRKFKGEEKNFLRTHYARSTEEWTERETLESKFVAVYCANFLVELGLKADGWWLYELDKFGLYPTDITDRRNLKWQISENDPKLIYPSAYPQQKINFDPSALSPQPSALYLNQAFIFPTTKRGNETIRMPIYQIRWTENLAKNSVFNDTLKIVMNNAIWHKH